MAVQWLGLPGLTTKDLVSIPSQGTKIPASRVAQPKKGQRKETDGEIHKISAKRKKFQKENQTKYRSKKYNNQNKNSLEGFNSSMKMTE